VVLIGISVYLGVSFSFFETCFLLIMSSLIITWLLLTVVLCDCLM
jgi:hypothetical protein